MGRAEHSRSARFETNSAIFKDALPLLVKVDNRRILTLESYLTESEKALEASKILSKIRATPDSKRKVDGCTNSARKARVQNLPGPIIHSLRNVYEYAILFEKRREIPH